ncbi:MAG: hypothetical protein EXR50_02725 [Dehalococcoidia bacterium]|nr:hypothetical protein [Dehalococcoidia bacterium]
MSLRDHLEPEEHIQSRCDPFYATSRRLIRYQLTREGEKIQFLSYRGVKSVELVRKPQHKLMVAGTLMSATGLFLFVYLMLWTAIPAFFMGIGLIIYGGQGNEVYYQIHFDNMTAQEKELWRIRIRGSKDFIASIADITGRPVTES